MTGGLIPPKELKMKVDNMVAYKLMRKMRDGSFAPLFCGRKTRYLIGNHYTAVLNETKGFSPRKGFRCTALPYAPHLSTKNRVWVKMEVSNLVYFDRPKSQGGQWILAQEMKILRELIPSEVSLLTKNIK